MWGICFLFYFCSGKCTVVWMSMVIQSCIVYVFLFQFDLFYFSLLCYHEYVLTCVFYLATGILYWFYREISLKVRSYNFFTWFYVWEKCTVSPMVIQDGENVGICWLNWIFRTYNMYFDISGNLEMLLLLYCTYKWWFSHSNIRLWRNCH